MANPGEPVSNSTSKPQHQVAPAFTLNPTTPAHLRWNSAGGYGASFSFAICEFLGHRHPPAIRYVPLIKHQDQARVYLGLSFQRVKSPLWWWQEADGPQD